MMGKSPSIQRLLADFRLQGDSSQIHVSSGGQISVKMAGDGDQPGNNGMRFVGKDFL